MTLSNVSYRSRTRQCVTELMLLVNFTGNAELGVNTKTLIMSTHAYIHVNRHVYIELQHAQTQQTRGRNIEISDNKSEKIEPC